MEGRSLAASPRASGRTPYFYPGGDVAGRPVPAGWYSEPWWKTALTAGAWGVGSYLLFDALFSGMGGVPYEHGFSEGYQEGFEAGQDADSSAGGGDWGDGGGGDLGGGDW